ncbi:MAG TPA: GNAT family N-acetyltransferase [Ktedonobacterales bacterium]|nr:GNAT family N-acetyltransferase [Ktedonobacterales bacterium]
MASLQPMTEDDYNTYMPRLREEYAAERAQSDDTSLEQERKVASEQMAGLLPQGLHTPEHCFWRVVAEDGALVGTLWVHVQPAERRAFIYDIEIDAAQRGKGYGEAAMRALEEQLRPQGFTHIGLNVFGPNTVARALYDKMGYRVAATYMLKRIASDAG